MKADCGGDEYLDISILQRLAVRARNEEKSGTILILGGKKWSI